MGDAALTTRSVLSVLQDFGKNYLFCVKNNPPTLLEAIVQTFATVDWDKPEKSKVVQKIEKRGCVINRKIAVNTADTEFVREAWNVPNCCTRICTVREVLKDKERKSCEKCYFVSSLATSKVPTEHFLTLSSGHWQIENRLFKDRWWDKDKHVLFRPGLGKIWSALTDLTVSLLWTWGTMASRSQKSNGSRDETNRIPRKIRLLKNLKSDSVVTLDIFAVLAMMVSLQRPRSSTGRAQHS